MANKSALGSPPPNRRRFLLGSCSFRPHLPTNRDLLQVWNFRSQTRDKHLELFAQPLGFNPFALLECVRRRDLPSDPLDAPERSLIHRRVRLAQPSTTTRLGPYFLGIRLAATSTTRRLRIFGIRPATPSTTRRGHHILGIRLATTSTTRRGHHILGIRLATPSTTRRGHYILGVRLATLSPWNQARNTLHHQTRTQYPWNQTRNTQKQRRPAHARRPSHRDSPNAETQ